MRFCGWCLQVKSARSSARVRAVQHGKQLVFGPSALHFGEDGRADQDFPARVLLAGYLETQPLAGFDLLLLGLLRFGFVRVRLSVRQCLPCELSPVVDGRILPGGLG
jgi:hypothetical protein